MSRERQEEGGDEQRKEGRQERSTRAGGRIPVRRARMAYRFTSGTPQDEP